MSWRYGLLAVVGAAASGCFGPSRAEEAARLAALEDEGAVLAERLDEVEERLLGNQARIHLWQELASRRKQVSAIACENAETHVKAMALHLEKQKRPARVRVRRVASVDEVLSPRRASRAGRRRN